ncbi:MAG: ABC transporter ATP-binding protein/permease, partial [Gemmatimonadota bacterium]|nr:ABC transporter ATP-binding protein/permease [Gemmatimonadota bacterium]
LFVSGTLLALLSVALLIVQPWPLKWILDSLSGSEAGGAIAQWITDSQDVAIPVMAGLFLLFSFGAAAAEFGQMLILNGFGNRVLYKFRSALFTHVLQQPLAYHESHEVGELLTRIVYDISRLRRGLNSLLTQTFKTLVLFAGTTAVLVWLHLGLGLVLALGGLIALWSMNVRGHRIARAARKQRKKEGSLATMVANELMTVRELQTFGAGPSGKFSNKNTKSFKEEQKVRKLAAGLTMRVDLIQAVAVAIVLWFGTRAVLEDTMTPGTLVVFFSYALSLRTPFVRFARQAAKIGRTRACGERLIKLAEKPIAIQDAPDAIDAPEFEGDITLDHASLKVARRRRSDRKWAIRQFSAVIPAKRRVAIVGANGSGKSTLLRLVLRLADPKEGSVQIDGHDLRSLKVKSVRRQMSVVFQDSVLSGLSVRDNIALGVDDVDDEAVVRAAKAVNAHKFVEKLPKGYKTQIRRGGKLFSGGERQRIAIARALLHDGAIWLLDEPTTGLDHATGAEIVAKLFGATKDRTTLWVTHDPELIPRMDWVVFLKKGKVSFSGPVADYATWAPNNSAPYANIETKETIS